MDAAEQPAPMIAFTPAPSTLCSFSRSSAPKRPLLVSHLESRDASIRPPGTRRPSETRASERNPRTRGRTWGAAAPATQLAAVARGAEMVVVGATVKAAAKAQDTQRKLGASPAEPSRMMSSLRPALFRHEVHLGSQYYSPRTPRSLCEAKREHRHRLSVLLAEQSTAATGTGSGFGRLQKA
eukprot:1390114-Prymnesium_polylepis.2